MSEIDTQIDKKDFGMQRCRKQCHSGNSRGGGKSVNNHYAGHEVDLEAVLCVD